MYKNVKFQWSEDCEDPFQFFKAWLESPELLSYSDLSCSFILQTNASDFALGYILAQEENDALMPIRCGGRVLTPSETGYAPTKRELLAIFYAVKREELYLKGNHFIVYADYEPLTNS